MKPMLDAPEATASPSVRNHRRKDRSTIPREDVLKPASTALTQQVLDIIEAEAALEYITPAQVMRRIILKHYKPLLKG
jgi:hypothetical protein